MHSAVLALVAAFLAASASAQDRSAERAAAAAKQIALSPDLATAIFAGLFLLSLLIFGIKMLDGIETSDKIGKNKPELTQ
jgi:hypothetical protein